MPLGDKTWHYWVPIVAQATMLKDIFNNGIFGTTSRFFKGAFSPDNSNHGSLEDQAYQLGSDARQQFLDDRQHTEMREDNAVQRLVADYQAAGLNPASLSGTTGASSSASNVGSDTITNKLQILGYILDLKQLDAKNRQITNQAISNYLSVLKKK